MKKDIQNLLQLHKQLYKGVPSFDNEIELIIDKLQCTTNIPKLVIRDIIDSQFRTLKQVISNEGLLTKDSKFEDFKSIRLMRLGSFFPSEKKIFHMVNNFKKEKQKKTNV